MPSKPNERAFWQSTAKGRSAHWPENSVTGRAIGCLLSELHPGGALPGALHAPVDEAHAGESLLHAGEIEVRRREVGAGLLPDQRRRERLVDVGEGLEIALGMARRNARVALRPRVEAVAPARKDLRGLAQLREGEVVGILLRPGNRSLRADHPDTQGVVVADRHLRRPVEAPRTALEVDEDGGVVVEGPPGDQRIETGAQPRDPEPGEGSHHVLDMGADVADAKRLPRHLRVAPPGCLLVEAIALEGSGEPLLRILGVHEPELAQIAAGDHLPRMLYRGITRVRVRDAEKQLFAAREGGQLLRLRHLEGERLVAGDVDAAREECPGRGEVGAVGVTITAKSIP